MRTIWLLLLLSASIVGPPPVIGMACEGANHAMLMAVAGKGQERSTPPGEWCQRPTTRMSSKAHACDCHKHDCTKDDSDPDNLSAHTDANCLNYCTTANCRCAVMDCK